VQNGAVLFNGTIGSTPVSGAGTRMMWIPGKAAFRVGNVSGTQWDESQIGWQSVALGTGTIANASYSVAIGEDARSTAQRGVAIGGWVNGSEGIAGPESFVYAPNGVAFGGGEVYAPYGVALGYDVDASAQYAFATGYSTVAGGRSSVVHGEWAQAIGNYSSVLGGYAVYVWKDYSLAYGYALEVTGERSILLGSGDEAWSTPLVNPYNRSLMVGWNATQPAALFVNQSAVGIGAITGAHRLTVNGSANITGNLYGGTVYSGGNQVCTASNGLCAGSSAGSGWFNTSTQVYLANNATNVSVGAAVPVLFVDTANKRVGINTSSPAAKLDVYGGDIYVSGASNVRFVIGDTQALGDYGQLQWNTSQDDLEIETTGSGDDVVLQPGGGRVGIGTNNPSSILSVNGNSSFAGNTTFTIGTGNEVCFERFVGTTQNYTRCINSTGHVTERFGNFVIQ
jgi:hypothetical protein